MEKLGEGGRLVRFLSCTEKQLRMEESAAEKSVVEFQQRKQNITNNCLRTSRKTRLR